mmetsp:Transcript_11972/g.22214  ORF Transcript_11972/g.22214 Transcript_11972/m.22214 type:complete len:265 (-) Transcript_11972:1099-1893(-)
MFQVGPTGVLEGDLLYRLVRRGKRFSEVVSHSGNSQYTSSGASCDISIIHLGSSMVHLDILHRSRLIQPTNFHTLGIRLRIALSGTYHRGGRDIFLEADIDGGEGAIAARAEYLVEIGFEEGEDHLGFGVAEAAVEFEDGGSVGREHHASIQNTNIRSPPLRHLLHSLDTHGLNLLLQFRSDTRCRSIGTHTPRIQTLISIQRTFVILRGRHEDSSLSIAECEARCFRTGHETFYDADIPCGSECFVGHDFVNGGDGFFLGGGK